MRTRMRTRMRASVCILWFPCYYRAYGLWVVIGCWRDFLSWVFVQLERKIIKPTYASCSLRLLKTRFGFFYWVWMRHLKYIPWLKAELRLRLINGPWLSVPLWVTYMILSVLCVTKEFSKAAFSNMNAIQSNTYRLLRFFIQYFSKDVLVGVSILTKYHTL